MGVAVPKLITRVTLEPAATATMMLDRLLLGEETAETVIVNRPIAYADTITKYIAIYNEVKELFAIN